MAEISSYIQDFLYRPKGFGDQVKPKTLSYIHPPSADLANCPFPKELDQDSKYKVCSKLEGKTYLKEGRRNNGELYLWEKCVCSSADRSNHRNVHTWNSGLPECGGPKAAPPRCLEMSSRDSNSVSEACTGWPPGTVPRRQPSPGPAQEFLIWFPSPRADTGLSFQINSYFLRNEIWNQMKRF